MEIVKSVELFPPLDIGDVIPSISELRPETTSIQDIGNHRRGSSNNPFRFPK